VPTPPTDIAEAQEALRRAREARLEVAKMRGRTHNILRDLDSLMAKNHLATAVRMALEGGREPGR
jgi:hypothetical protein